MKKSSVLKSNRSSHTKRIHRRGWTSLSKWILTCVRYLETVTPSSITCQTSVACKVCLSVQSWWCFPYGIITTSTIIWSLASSSLKGMRGLSRLARLETSKSMLSLGCPTAASALSVVNLANLIGRSYLGVKSWPRKRTSWASSSRWDISGQPLHFWWRKVKGIGYWRKVSSTRFILTSLNRQTWMSQSGQTVNKRTRWKMLIRARPLFRTMEALAEGTFWRSSLCSLRIAIAGNKSKPTIAIFRA